MSRAEAASALHFSRALLPEGWRSDVRLSLAAGRIAAIDVGAAAKPEDRRHEVGLPGVANVHSHAFQRGMAGLAEWRGRPDDDFWSWRETMYRFALAIDPDEAEAVAAMAYVEMLESGFVRVGEFHYLHHAPDGRPYANLAEMALRIAAAAQTTGIGLTLLPVFYAHADFGGRPPHAGQRRFLCDLDGYFRLVEASQAAIAPLNSAALGLAPHSLRAVDEVELKAITGHSSGQRLHIHVAEQTGEVDACLAHCGRRSVDRLLDLVPVDRRWTLIHATHMTSDETSRLASTGAVVSLCPITEANLGDGVFPAGDFLAHGGAIGVGTDSNVEIGLGPELRMLEYTQRLAHRRRNVLATDDGSTARALFDGVRAGGERAVGIGDDGLRVGAAANVVALREDVVAAASRPDTILDRWVFAGQRPVESVYVGGLRVVAEGRHVARDAVERRFRRAMNRLRTIL